MTLVVIAGRGVGGKRDSRRQRRRENAACADRMVRRRKVRYQRVAIAAGREMTKDVDLREEALEQQGNDQQRRKPAYGRESAPPLGAALGDPMRMHHVLIVGLAIDGRLGL
jgi:hypothetical protein